MRKVYANVTVRLIVNIDEGTTLDEVVENMDYEFTASDSTNADIVDTEIREVEVIDSK